MSDFKKCPQCRQDACINQYEHSILCDRRKTMAVCCDCGFTCWKGDWNILSERMEEQEGALLVLAERLHYELLKGTNCEGMGPAEGELEGTVNGAIKKYKEKNDA